MTESPHEHLDVLIVGAGISGIGAAVHIERDVTTYADVEEHVVRMARAVTAEVVADGRVVTHVAVKLRSSTFYTRTKIGKLPDPTTDPDAVAAHARVVLARFELGRPLRLIGVRVMLDMTGS